jgi:hypothetical protein
MSKPVQVTRASEISDKVLDRLGGTEVFHQATRRISSRLWHISRHIRFMTNVRLRLALERRVRE